jgi:hypothetical protein
MKFALFLAPALLLGATSAEAITYVGSASGISLTGTMAPTTVSYEITTDGTLGTLGAANFTGFSITVDVNGNSLTTSGTPFTQIFGPVVSATATQLLYDFTQPGAFVLFEPNSTQAVCFTNDGSECAGAGPVTAWISYPLSVTSFQSQPQGSMVIGSAVPEPTSWAMLIAGFGLTGAAMRRRRTVQTA